MRFKNFFAAMLLVGFTLPVAHGADGDLLPAEVRVERIERSENNLFVTFQLDFTDLKLNSNREVSFIPVICAGDSSVTLPKVVVAGRNRYIQNQRKRRPAAGDVLTRSGSVVDYAVMVPYRKWMENSRLVIAEDVCGCGFSVLSSTSKEVAHIDLRELVFAPQWAYVVPAVETRKARNASGSAYIDFRVNRTDIDPAYRRNPQELAAIRDTIDMIKNDPDSRIDAVDITGYASPEGSYANNERLARGRTASLADYVCSLYDFPRELLHTSSVAEDWAGLIKYVEGSSLADREAILSLISDESIEPDVRDNRLRARFPEQYAFLLREVYQSLRHSDYKVNYTVQSFSDTAKIAKVMKENPRKLSLHEMYTLAQTLPADSEDFREVFEVAVRLYPDDPVANLNAAFTAMRFGDLGNAGRYLAKAGDSTSAVYARGIFAAMQGDYEAARRNLESVSTLPQAVDALGQLREMGKI